MRRKCKFCYCGATAGKALFPVDISIASGGSERQGRPSSEWLKCVMAKGDGSTATCIPVYIGLCRTGNDQHLELCTETDWKPVQLPQKRSEVI